MTMQEFEVLLTRPDGCEWTLERDEVLVKVKILLHFNYLLTHLNLHICLLKWIEKVSSSNKVHPLLISQYTLFQNASFDGTALQGLSKNAVAIRATFLVMLNDIFQVRFLFIFKHSLL